MTTISGPDAVIAPTIASSCTSASSSTGALTSPSRCARSATCSTDSSPVMYSVRCAAPSAALACNSSVDFPMPGSPPISTTPPGHEAAAQHAVELLEPGWNTGRVAGLYGGQRDNRRARSGNCREAHRRGRRHRFDERVPGSALRTLTLPLGRGATAFGAGVDGLGLCQVRPIRSGAPPRCRTCRRRRRPPRWPREPHSAAKRPLPTARRVSR